MCHPVAPLQVVPLQLFTFHIVHVFDLGVLGHGHGGARASGITTTMEHLTRLASSLQSSVSSTVFSTVSVVNSVLPGNPVTREFEATEHIASAGPGTQSIIPQLCSFGKDEFCILIQRTSVTVTLMGIGKSVNVADCHYCMIR